MKKQNEQGNLRITSYNNSSIRIMNCEFAGKRGKVCEEVSIYVSADDRSNQGQAFCDVVHNMDIKLADLKNLDDVTKFVELAQSLEGMKVETGKSEHKAVRIQPLGFEDISFGNDHYHGSVGWEDFTFSDLTDHNNCPRYIDTSRTKKADYKKVYEFVKKNLDKLNNSEVSFWDAINMIQEATGVSGHHYCAMD